MRIVELVGRGGAPSADVDETFDAARHVVLPGLINTHHHFFQTLTRAHPDAINKELFAWLKALYPVWSRHMTAEAFRLATRLALTELLMSGCTCVSDHQYLFPRGLEGAMDIQAQEAARLGMRMTLSREVSRMPWGAAAIGLLVGFLIGLTGMGGGAMMTPLLLLDRLGRADRSRRDWI